MNKKTVIFTAASRGIGEACARKLAHLDYNIVLMSTSKNIFLISEELNCTSLRGSVTEKKDLENVVQLALDTYGNVDAVINNTGHAPKGDILGISDEDWYQTMDLYLMNVIRISKILIPVMKTNKKGGAIVNISAFGSEKPSLDFPTSSVIRSALNTYTTLFARRFGPNGIRMNNLSPGFVDSYAVEHKMIDSIPLGRVARVSEIADAVLFLISDESRYITGQNILIDGSIVIPN